MGRQISFAATVEEMPVLEQTILKDTSGLTYADVNPTRRLMVLPADKSKPGELNWLTAWIVRKEDMAKIKLSFVKEQNYWVLESLPSPAIQLSRPTPQEPTGRLHYETGYFDDKDVWVPREDSFLQFAALIFLRLRRLTSRDPKTGVYVTDAYREYERSLKPKRKLK